MAANALSYLRLPVLASSALTLLASSLLYFKQNELIYARNLPIGARKESGVPKPAQFGISDYEDLRLPTPDGETLAAYFIRASSRRKRTKTTVLMFHGNAGNIGHRIPIARALEQNVDCDILMLEYRGYGLSTGSPDEEGIKIDAQTGLDWIRSNEETRDSSIVIYGQSLGGAVAISLVAKNQGTGDIVGLILENTFLSVRKMIPSAFPPAKYLAPLCHQRWSSEEMLPQITDIPILFISGLRDEIVPPSHMKQLFSICRASTKIWKELPAGSHNDTVAEPGYFAFVAEFVNNQIMHRSTAQNRVHQPNFRHVSTKVDLNALTKSTVADGRSQVSVVVGRRRGAGGISAELLNLRKGNERDAGLKTKKSGEMEEDCSQRAKR